MALPTDTLNCGVCGRACLPGQTCLQGTCICPLGGTVCSGTCRNLAIDPANCGECGGVCPAGSVCGAGRCGSPRINALHPAIVDGDSGIVRIEGSFGSSATVTFPGVATPVAATVLGPTRIEVSVPPGATAGDLTVRTAGSVITNGLRFRRASFGLGLQPFRPRYEQADYARQTPSLNTARVHAASVNTGRWLYLIGGVGDTGAPLSSIERAMINADGTLGAFQAVATGLGTPREGGAAVLVGSTVYVMGGLNRGEATNTIVQATVDANGLLSTFTPVASGLQVARGGHVAEIIGGYVYVFGGDTDVVERAPIASDGTLGAFLRVEGVTTRARRQWATSQVIGGAVYLIGGAAGATALSSLERAAINPTIDSIDDFQVSRSLSVTRVGAASAVLGTRLYVAGGTDGTTARSSVEATDLSPSGALQLFAPVAARSLSAARHGAASSIIGNYWYLVGGADIDAVRSLDRAEINGTGVLSSAHNLTPPGLSAPRILSSVVAIGRYVYVIGGGGDNWSDPRRIERAPVLADGSLGTFAAYNPGGTDPAYRTGASIAVVGTAMYLVGGASGPGAFEGTMLRIPINDDGSLGTVAATAAGTDYAYGRAIVLDDRVCIFGGTNASGSTSSIMCATIGAGSSLGMFAVQSAHLPVARYYNAAVLLGGAVHLIGGNDGNTIFSTIVRCGVAAGISGCADITNRLSTARLQVSSSVIVGNRMVCAGGANNTTTFADAEGIAIGADGSLAAGMIIPDLSLPSGGIKLHSSIVLDNAALLIGGMTRDGVSGAHQQIDLR